MPQTQYHGGRTYTFATEEELLSFVNKAREAGGANVLEALLPSEPNNAEQCLIARGLNFSCEVYPGYYHPTTSEEHWAMCLPHSMEYEQANRIAQALNCDLLCWTTDDHWKLADGSVGEVSVGERTFRILLPHEIGTAAFMFDAGWAFQEYRL